MSTARGKMSTASHNRLGQIRARKYRQAYLSEHPCVDCGEQDITLLEFDHRPGTHKINNVSCMHSIYKIQEKIAKCDVRCSACHHRRHARERQLENSMAGMGNGFINGCGGVW